MSQTDAILTNSKVIDGCLQQNLGGSIPNTDRKRNLPSTLWPSQNIEKSTLQKSTHQRVETYSVKGGSEQSSRASPKSATLMIFLVTSRFSECKKNAFMYTSSQSQCPNNPLTRNSNPTFFTSGIPKTWEEAYWCRSGEWSWEIGEERGGEKERERDKKRTDIVERNLKRFPRSPTRMFEKGLHTYCRNLTLIPI